MTSEGGWYHHNAFSQTTDVIPDRCFQKNTSMLNSLINVALQTLADPALKQDAVIVWAHWVSHKKSCSCWTSLHRMFEPDAQDTPLQRQTWTEADRFFYSKMQQDQKQVLCKNVQCWKLKADLKVLLVQCGNSLKTKTTPFDGDSGGNKRKYLLVSPTSVTAVVFSEVCLSADKANEWKFKGNALQGHKNDLLMTFFLNGVEQWFTAAFYVDTSLLWSSYKMTFFSFCY